MLLSTLLFVEMAIVAPAFAAEGRVEGIVLFGGSPLPDIPVVLSGELDYRSVTGPEGTFVIPAPPGTYTLTLGGEETRNYYLREITSFSTKEKSYETINSRQPEVVLPLG